MKSSCSSSSASAIDQFIFIVYLSLSGIELHEVHTSEVIGIIRRKGVLLPWKTDLRAEEFFLVFLIVAVLSPLDVLHLSSHLLAGGH